MALIPDITGIPSDQYVSLNTLSGLAIGTAMRIQNKGTVWIHMIQSVSKPAGDVVDGSLLGVMPWTTSVGTINASGDEVWVRSSNLNGSAKISVQEG